MRILIVAPDRRSVAARASVRSCAVHAPDARVTVVTLGHAYRPIGAEHVLPVADLPVERAELHRAGGVLDDDALALWIAARTAAAADDELLLLSPGVELRWTPEPLLAAARESGVAVLPRRPGPMEWRDAVDAADLGNRFGDLLVAVAPAGRGTAARLADLLLDRPGLGTSALDEVLAASPHAVLRDPAALIGPATRLTVGELVRDGSGQLLRGATPVMALDLTQFDPEQPWVLSPAGSTVLLSEQPALAADLEEAAAQRASDPPAPGGTRDEFAWTTDGLPMHQHLRDVLREHDPVSDGTPDPFDTAAPSAFTDWLLRTLPAGHPAPVARYLAEAYSARPDLRSTFPLVPGPDTARLLDWAEQHGVGESEYDADLLLRSVAASRAAALPEEPRDPDAGPTPGVNLVGYLTGELGVGESARLVRSALEAVGVPVATVPVAHQLQSRQSSPFRPAGRPPHFDTTVLCVNADQTPAVAASVAQATPGAHRVGMWYWEVEEFPEAYRQAFAEVDEVWVATDFVRRAVERHSTVPVLTLMPPLPQVRSGAPAGVLPAGVPADRQVLLFSFDHLSSTERKNPWGLVEAFRRAFAPDEGPVLVLKSINAARATADAERLRLLVADRPDVVLVEEYLSAEDRDALMAHCHAYVSLHRAEGLGLSLAEAMAHGKPVVATGYSGNLQFQTTENSLLVPYTLTEIPRGAGPYPAGARWAEPDLDEAAALMRRVVAEPAWAAAVGAQAAADIRERHSPAVAGAAIAARLEAIRESRRPANRGRRLPRLRRRGG